MLSTRFLECGLMGLARCGSNPWDAHYPAAVLAGFYYAAHNRLATETERGLETQLDRLMATKAGCFVPYPPGPRIPDAAAPILEALSVSIDKFSELGHNAIFAAFALRALRDLGGTGHERLVLDLASLIRQFDLEPARYWLRLAKGHDPRKFSLPVRTIFTDATSDTDIARLILGELPKFRHVYTQMGSKSHLGHLLTQSQALLTLRQLGYPQYANRGLYSLECRFTLLKASQEHRSSPLSFYRPATRSALLPDEPAFWAQDFARCEWDEGHVFKYTFSFGELVNLLQAEADLKAAATEKFRYLISPGERAMPT